MSMHTINNQTSMKTTSIPSSNLFVPYELGKLSVTYRGREFYVVDQNGSESAVKRMDLSKELRGINDENIEKIANAGYIAVQKVGNDYALQFNGRLQGGGPILAVFTYVTTAVAGCVVTAVGVVTLNPVVAGAGVSMVTAAPYAAVAVLGTPTP